VRGLGLSGCYVSYCIYLVPELVEGFVLAGPRGVVYLVGLTGIGAALSIRVRSGRRPEWFLTIKKPVTQAEDFFFHLLVGGSETVICYSVYVFECDFLSFVHCILCGCGPSP